MVLSATRWINKNGVWAQQIGVIRIISWVEQQHGRCRLWSGCHLTYCINFPYSAWAKPNLRGSEGKKVLFTFYYINFSKGEADGLGHSLNVGLQLSLWQWSKLVKEGRNVVRIDCYQYLRIIEKHKGSVITMSQYTSPSRSYRSRTCIIVVN